MTSNSDLYLIPMQATVLFILFLLIGVPVILTLINIVMLFCERKAKKAFSATLDILIFALGIPFTALLWLSYEFVEWDVQVDDLYGLHDNLAYTPISYEFMPAILLTAFLAFLGFALIRAKKGKLPPLICALCYCAMFVGCILSVACIVQVSEHFTKGVVWLFTLLPFNYILCAVRVMRGSVREIAASVRDREYSSPILRFCQRVTSNSAGFMLFSFLMTAPFLFVILTVLVLFGQAPDAHIRAFTETAEWTLSQKIPPPRLDYHGHYLCTVAARGDEKVVKPLRAGKRRGRLIVVNRQLLVANAFEDLIMEKAPRLHKIIRGIYDRTGLPISKYINTRSRSNAVYLLMKPLEWLFVIILYSLDRKPENRIALQYTK